MSVAARYLNRELAGVFVVTLLLLLLVAVGGRFIGYLQEAALGKFTGSTVLTIIGLRMSEFVQLVAPFSVYVAIILTLGRWYADQEMVVLQSAGTSTLTFLRWVGVTLSGVVALVAVLTWLATPVSQRALVEFMAEQRAQTEFESLNPGIFHTYDNDNRVTYSREMSDDRRVLYDVFLSQRLEDGRRINVWADRGTQEVDAGSRSQFLILESGKRYELGAAGMGLRIMEFGQLRQRLEKANPRGNRVKPETMSMLELGNDPDSLAEWHWRVSMPLFTLIGGLIAMGISRVKPRQGRFTRVLPGMLLMVGYYLVMLVNHNALVEEQIPQAMGMWPVHAIFACVAVFLLKRLAQPLST